MKKAIKIIGICGSPHTNGNTSKLIKKILEGCEKAGADTEFISLANKRILFCEACYKCLKEKECVLEDDLNEIRKKMIESDGLIIGSPTYNREITGQLKTFYDRIWYDIHRHTFLKKYAICITTYILTLGYTDKTLRNLTMALGYNMTGKINAKLWKFNNEIEEDSKTMRKAFDMGKRIVENIESQKKYLKQNLIRKIFIKSIFRKISKLMEVKGLL